ncbi:MAG: histidinol-phosphatase HisJ family protein [Verrucomicrobiota bacterium]|nr:histidinol-phosphatase HisJ family protein [Verrucomicrobiota bacterium]
MTTLEISSPSSFSSWPADYHTHTYLCRHAEYTPLDYSRAAAEKGIPEIACTDHIPFPNDPAPSIRMALDEFDLYLSLVREAQAQGPCPVLLGVEADYRRDLVDGYIQQLLDRTDFDLVLGSLHTGPFWDLMPDDPTATPEFVEQMWRTYFLRMADLADARLFDVCSHFDIVKRNGCRPSEKVLAEIVPPALDAVAQAGMAIEINTSGLEHAAAECYPSMQILAWMQERSIPITFGSDAHAPSQVGRHFEPAADLVKSAGYTTRASFRKRICRQVSL